MTIGRPVATEPGDEAEAGDRVPGVVGLLGGNEMRPDCRAFDEALLRAAGNPGEVFVVPAAVVRNGSVEAAMRLARQYFGELGLAATHVPLHRRSDANNRDVAGVLRGSRLTYLLGGDPGYLLDCLEQSRAWTAMAGALAEGGAIAGSSAGAMVLAGRLLLRSRNPRPQARHGRPALALVPGTVVLPHMNTFGRGWLEPGRREAPGDDLLGLDEATGVTWAGGDGGWTVHGPGAVRVWPRGTEPPAEAHEGDRPPVRVPAIPSRG